MSEYLYSDKGSYTYDEFKMLFREELFAVLEGLTHDIFDEVTGVTNKVIIASSEIMNSYLISDDEITYIIGQLLILLSAGIWDINMDYESFLSVSYDLSLEINDLKTQAALNILFEYLTGSNHFTFNSEGGAVHLALSHMPKNIFYSDKYDSRWDTLGY